MLTFVAMLWALVCMACVGWRMYADGKRWNDPSDKYFGLTLFMLCCALIGAMFGLLLV
jgi:hypothetical protein